MNFDFEVRLPRVCATQTDAAVLLVTFWMYGLSMLGLAFLIASVVSRVRIANLVALVMLVIGFIYVSVRGRRFRVRVCGGGGGGVVHARAQVAGNTYAYTLFDTYLIPRAVTNLVMLYPPCDFAKIFHDISYLTQPTQVWDAVALAVVTLPGKPYKWASLYNDTYSAEGQPTLSTTHKGSSFYVPPSIDQINWLVLVACVASVGAWYLGQLFPGEYGRPQRPWFFLLPSYWESCGRGAVRDASPSIRVTELVKKFGSFTAVAGLELEMKCSQTYCLLGHNGAGKTTAIRMITGHLGPTSGDVVAGGYSVNAYVDRIRAMMGVCPQHDIIWEDLTAREHLETCARDDVPPVCAPRPCGACEPSTRVCADTRS